MSKKYIFFMFFILPHTDWIRKFIGYCPYISIFNENNGKNRIEENIHLDTFCYPFKRQPHKMGKQIQTIRQQFADKLFECVWPFCEVGA